AALRRVAVVPGRPLAARDRDAAARRAHEGALEARYGVAPGRDLDDERNRPHARLAARHARDRAREEPLLLDGDRVRLAALLQREAHEREPGLADPRLRDLCHRLPRSLLERTPEIGRDGVRLAMPADVRAHAHPELLRAEVVLDHPHDRRALLVRD